jgi:SAM-dependent methyltransferase
VHTRREWKLSVSIWDAIIRLVDSPPGDRVPLLPGLEDGITLGALVDRLRADAENAAAWPIAKLLDRLLEFEKAGLITIEETKERGPVLELLVHLEAVDRLVGQYPGLNNVVSDHFGWTQDAPFYDYLHTGSELDLLKRFEANLYLQHLETYLQTLPEQAAILDAGCGIGRFAEPLAQRGFCLTLVDVSRDALMRALRNLAEAGYGEDKLNAHVADFAALSFAEDDAFDATIAMEAICYHSDPGAVLREMKRVTRPDGLIFLSVEGRYGSMLSDHKMRLGDVTNLSHTETTLCRDKDVHVTYYTEASLRSLLESEGLRCLELIGSHYVTEGPFDHLVEWTALEKPEVQKRVLELEHLCAQDPVFRPLARAWIAICQAETS